MATTEGMRSIWYIVGLILTAIGLLVLVAGAVDLVQPSSGEVRLAELHANVWWGAVILLAGVLYVVKNRHRSSEA